MATVTHTLSITSTDLTSDSISMSVTNTLGAATQGGIMRQKIEPTVIGSGQIIADEDLYTQGARLWLYNPSTSTSGEKIYISFDSTTDQIILSGGDWALIPWAASNSGTPVSIEAYAESANNILEYGIFN
tara:strand:+ start:89 stop:478 length:390 start_codon:yes stop_codon:yes gene_type:complete